MILRELQAIQERCGYLPREAMLRLADRLSTPLYRLEEVAGFYPHFRREPPPPCEIHVCRDMACCLRGSREVVRSLQASNQLPAGVIVKETSCLGRCDRAPAAMAETHVMEEVDVAHETLLVHVDSARISAFAKGAIAGDVPHGDTDLAYAADQAKSWSIDPYADQPAERYASIRRFLACKTDEDRETFRDDVIRALETAGLLGMGGAGGRAYKKWSEVRQAVGSKKYVVCNGDESEPGTFKDREILLRTPHLTVEGVILGGLVTGAERGYIYIRHEYPEAIAAVNAEIARAEAAGMCGAKLGEGAYPFRLETFVSPGGYICGEQTALIEAIEDKRAEPRNRPPELQTNGLWDKPTLLNNVETLAWVPAIMEREAGAWYAASAAAPEYKGRRFFSVSGDIARPGAYEVPVGITLGELIDQYCGGIRNGERFKAIALSGPSGGFLPAAFPADRLPTILKDSLAPGETSYDLRKLPLDIGYFRKLKWMLGAGIVIYGESADMVEQSLACSEFYRDESCGKCVPCRIGSHKIAEIAQLIRDRKLTHAEIAAFAKSDGTVAELSQTMTITAICGLGTVASNPLATLLAYFPDELRRYERAEP